VVANGHSLWQIPASAHQFSRPDCSREIREESSIRSFSRNRRKSSENLNRTFIWNNGKMFEALSIKVHLYSFNGKKNTCFDLESPDITNPHPIITLSFYTTQSFKT
jgi:hypothetical protein